MTDPQVILLSAAQSTSKQDAPAIAAIAEALQQVERTRKQNPTLEYEPLLGTWQLCLVTKPRQGKQAKPTGQRIPAWLSIQITYTRELLLEPAALPQSPDQDSGSVHNQVQLGLLTLTLSGPTLFHRARGILAFDFTRLRVEVAGRSLYQGAIRGGTEQEEKFYHLSLKEQAFFRFFWITPQGIAARGKGGGLALWTKS